MLILANVWHETHQIKHWTELETIDEHLKKKIYEKSDYTIVTIIQVLSPSAIVCAPVCSKSKDIMGLG